jgi:hypothetical protein
VTAPARRGDPRRWTTIKDQKGGAVIAAELAAACYGRLSATAREAYERADLVEVKNGLVRFDGERIEALAARGKGRPSKPDAERHRRIHVGFPAGEVQRVAAAATARGLPVAAFVRAATMETIARVGETYRRSTAPEFPRTFHPGSGNGLACAICGTEALVAHTADTCPRADDRPPLAAQDRAELGARVPRHG